MPLSPSRLPLSAIHRPRSITQCGDERNGRRGRPFLISPFASTGLTSRKRGELASRRLGAELLEVGAASMTIDGSTEEWKAWTGLEFPDDGGYLIPGGLVPVRVENGRGSYVEPNVWMRHPVT